MPIKDATKKDIQELRRRLMDRKEQRILDRDVQESIDIIDKHREQIEKENNGNHTKTL